MWMHVKTLVILVKCVKLQECLTHTLRQKDLPLSLCLYGVGGIRTGIGTIPPQEAS